MERISEYDLGKELMSVYSGGQMDQNIVRLALQELKECREDRQKYEVFTRLITTALGDIMHDEEGAENVVRYVKHQAGLEVLP